MTKNENERLAIVETKIDNIVTDMAIVKTDFKASNTDLKEYITGELNRTMSGQKEDFKINFVNHANYCEKHEKEHKSLDQILNGKISIKAFGSWLGGATLFTGLVITALKLFNVI